MNAVEEDRLNVAMMMVIVDEKGENIEEIGENVGCLPAFSPFSTSFSRVVITLDCTWKSLTLYLICQFQAVQIQQQIKMWCQKNGQMGIQKKIIRLSRKHCGKRRNCSL